MNKNKFQKCDSGVVFGCMGDDGGDSSLSSSRLSSPYCVRRRSSKGRRGTGCSSSASSSAGAAVFTTSPSLYNVFLVAVSVLLIPSLPTARTILNTGNPDAKRLYDDLLSNYNKLVRPVVNTTDPLTVRIKLKLSQLIDVVSVCMMQ